MRRLRVGWTIGAAAALAFALASLSGAEPPARVLQAREIPVQRLREAPRTGRESLDSEHFVVRWDAESLSREKAELGREQAEKAWTYCRERFGREPRGKIVLDLTPEFSGATGFARPGDPNASDLSRRPMIGIRYGELDYLGLTPEYVVTHEVAHIFSGELAGSSLGEGIADWAAGTFSSVPSRPWWGRELRQAGLWIDPDAFFVTGEFDSTPEVNSVIRTAQYVESGLLVRYLVDRFGWPKVRAFAEEYGKARGRLESNEDRKRQPEPRRRPGSAPASGPPNREVIFATFERHFGEPWNRLRADWERQMAEDRCTPADARRLVLSQQIYGAIRNYEMWALEQRPPLARELVAVVREAFTEANRLLAAGELDRAEKALARARSMVEQLRRPSVVALELRGTNPGNFGSGTGVLLGMDRSTEKRRLG